MNVNKSWKTFIYKHNNTVTADVNTGRASAEQLTVDYDDEVVICCYIVTMFIQFI